MTNDNKNDTVQFLLKKYFYVKKRAGWFRSKAKPSDIDDTFENPDVKTKIAELDKKMDQLGQIIQNGSENGKPTDAKKKATGVASKFLKTSYEAYQVFKLVKLILTVACIYAMIFAAIYAVRTLKSEAPEIYCGLAYRINDNHPWVFCDTLHGYVPPPNHTPEN